MIQSVGKRLVHQLIFCKSQPQSQGQCKDNYDLKFEEYVFNITCSLSDQLYETLVKSGKLANNVATYMFSDRPKHNRA